MEDRGFLKLYHVSEDLADVKRLTPRVPDNHLVENGFEDKTTPRVCFCLSIDDALIAMSRNLSGKTLHVYTCNVDPDTKDFIPSEKLTGKVPDVLVTHEVWWLKPIDTKFEHSIKVTTAKDKPFEYKYGDKTAFLYAWNYSICNVKDELISESTNNSMTDNQIAFHNRNKRNMNIGKCRYCKSKTEWMEERGKYQILCGSQKCKDQANTEFRERMKKSRGVEYMTDNIEDQRDKLMANRKIAKNYFWGDMKYTVLGSLEYDTLRTLDTICKRDSKYVHAPAPFVVEYKHDTDGMKKHFPDIYLEDLELIISVKDGMSNPNKHPNFKKDRLKSLCEYRHILNNTHYNFLQVEGDSDIKELPAIIKKIEQMYPKSRYVSPPRVDMYMYYSECAFSSISGENIFFAIINDKLPCFVSIDTDTHVATPYIKNSKGDVILLDSEKFTDVKYYRYSFKDDHELIDVSGDDYNYMVEIYTMVTGCLPDDRVGIVSNVMSYILENFDEFNMDAMVERYKVLNSGNFNLELMDGDTIWDSL
ncbi:MAG: hypothetical protein ACRCZ9_12180 [Fusobacteriaceae bacterium]